MAAKKNRKEKLPPFVGVVLLQSPPKTFIYIYVFLFGTAACMHSYATGVMNFVEVCEKVRDLSLNNA